MGFERKDPIPPGRYWIDIPTDKIGRYNQWSLGNLNVKTVSSRHGGVMTFVVFVVGPTAAKRWPIDAGLGFPTVDKTGKVQAPEDVIQRPPPPEEFDLSDIFAGAKGGIVLLGLLYLLSRK